MTMTMNETTRDHYADYLRRYKPTANPVEGLQLSAMQWVDADGNLIAQAVYGRVSVRYFTREASRLS